MKAGLFEAELMEGHSDSLDEGSTKINQADSEVTPRRGIQTFVPCIKPRKRANISHSEKLKIRKKLTYSIQSTPTSFMLGNLHKHLLGIAAEADCESLLRTTAVLGEDWVKYVKDNSYPFATCNKMWGN